MSERYDVAVIGGGPAGSVFASLVRRQHPERSVLVLEKARFPRHHIGESLIPGIGPILARAGLLGPLEERAGAGSAVGVLRKVGIVYSWGAAERSAWTADFRDPTTGLPAAGSYQVDRSRFDRFLLDHAMGLGTHVIQPASVRSIAREGDGFVLAFDHEGERREARARWLVDASGLTRTLGASFGIPRKSFDDMNNYAIYAYWRGSRPFEHGACLKPGETWTFVSTTRDGWTWHIPIEGGLTSVGLVTSKEALPAGGREELLRFYLENVRACFGLNELLSEAEIVTHPHASAPLMVVRDWSSHATTLAGEGWFTIGDAAVFVDPILTSGIVLAILGSSLAAGALSTIWSAPRVDEALLRASYEETYLDLAAGYHRMASIWYRQNDKVRSWWWEARKQALRAGEAPSRTSDLRAFVGLSLGLVRDPFAGRARDRSQGVDLVRPDKILFAHHLFAEANAAESELVATLDRLTQSETGEVEARCALYQHLVGRWRTILDAPITLEDVEAKRRDRYYTDRTLPHWIRESFVECTLRRGDPRVDRIVLPADTDPDAPLGVTLDGRTLRAALDGACRGSIPGTREHDDRVQRAFDHVIQMDLRGWLRAPEEPIDPSAFDDARAAILALVRACSRGRIGVVVDLLGHGLELSFLDEPDAARISIVPLTWLGDRRTYARTATAGASYLARELSEPTRRVHDAFLARLRELEASAPSIVDAAWRGLARAAGLCRVIDEERETSSMPELLTGSART